jgi:sulfatase maturation enzyme AslB (radical SAM superfamily)
MEKTTFLFQKKMKFKKQHHIQQDPDHINIHWDTLTVCQLKCSYCYARNEYGKEWGKISSKEVIDAVVESLSRSSLNFNLGLLGGEPTLGPYYYYILDKITNLEKNNKIYVVTNAEKDFTDHLDYGEKIAFLFSYHPKDCTNRERFINNMKLMINRGYKCKVNIMLHHDKNFWPDIKEMFEICKDIDNLKVHPHFIYGKSISELFNYRKNFWEYFKFLEDYQEKELVYDDEVFNDYQIFNQKLTNFKGWNCWNNNYEIDVRGNVVKFCLDKKTGVSLLRDPDFFKKIEKTIPMICPHNSCNCDGLLKQYKEKNDTV